jgi:peptide deformylase
MSDTLIFNTEDAVKNDGRYIISQVNIFDLVPETDPILLEVMPQFDFQSPPVDPNAFASSLVETCKKNNGYGLSANQCGFRYRVFVMGFGEEFVAMFNPEIVAADSQTGLMVEGCLSFPALGLNVSRPLGVVVKYQDFTGETKTTNLTGLSARIFQHELDHMNGIMYTKRAKPLALQMGLKKRAKINKMIHKAKVSITKLEKLTS